MPAGCSSKLEVNRRCLHGLQDTGMPGPGDGLEGSVEAGEGGWDGSSEGLIQVEKLKKAGVGAGGGKTMGSSCCSRLVVIALPICTCLLINPSS